MSHDLMTQNVHDFSRKFTNQLKGFTWIASPQAFKCIKMISNHAPTSKDHLIQLMLMQKPPRVSLDKKNIHVILLVRCNYL